MDTLIRQKFELHCDEDGVQRRPMNPTRFYQQMYRSYPQYRKDLEVAIRKQVILKF